MSVQSDTEHTIQDQIAHIQRQIDALGLLSQTLQHWIWCQRCTACVTKYKSVPPFVFELGVKQSACDPHRHFALGCSARNHRASGLPLVTKTSVARSISHSVRRLSDDINLKVSKFAACWKHHHCRVSTLIIPIGHWFLRESGFCTGLG